jgi:Lipoprotein LpqB beta-propeller domain
MFALCAGCSTALAAPNLEAYGRLPQVELVRVSASGERVALIGVNGEKRQLVVAQVSGNKLLKAAGVGNNKVRDLRWAGDEHVLVFVTSTTETRSDYIGRGILDRCCDTRGTRCATIRSGPAETFLGHPQGFSQSASQAEIV